MVRSAYGNESAAFLRDCLQVARQHLTEIFQGLLIRMAVLARIDESVVVILAPVSSV